jgi:hypothetical protein
MTETQISLTRQALKTPRSAAIAGIIFAVLYGASMVLLNVSLSPRILRLVLPER